MPLKRGVLRKRYILRSQPIPEIPKGRGSILSTVCQKKVPDITLKACAEARFTATYLCRSKVWWGNGEEVVMDQRLF